MNDHLIYEDDIEYWKDVYRNKIKFASKKDNTVIPWDIKTFDPNLPEVVKSLNLKNGKLLEIGCGTGFDSNYFYKNGFDVTAIDISEEAIELAKSNNENCNIDFVVEDFFDYIPKDNFDIIYDRGFIHNYKQRQLEFFEKIFNIISSKGKLVIITGNPNQPKLETCMPPPVFFGEIEFHSFKWFKIILAKEIVFKTDENYEDCLGYLFILEKRDKVALELTVHGELNEHN